MKKIELVFRTIGERTSDIALDLARKNIRPDKVHVIENIKPFSNAMKKILEIEYQAEFIVFMDADCLILENLRPFLEKNDHAYVDCFVLDKFRGIIHTGVHITRRDVVEEMKNISIDENDEKYVLRPESRIRNIALDHLNEKKVFKRFRIFHDFFQNTHDVFVKYALRELRSRTEQQKLKLDFCMLNWHNSDIDYVIAKQAIKHTRKKISNNASSARIAKYIAKLPQIANNQMKKLQIIEKKPLKIREVYDLRAAFNTFEIYDSKKKIFCLGLSRTGTKSLTVALYILGYNIIHYPHDEETFEDLSNGNYNFSCLKDYDGISDITVSPYYAQLDKTFPKSKFILTVRDKETWLRSFEKHWSDRPPFNDPTQGETYMKVRRFLRASVYGTYKFNRDRMSYVYDMHLKNVLEYFKYRPQDFLVLNIFERGSMKNLCEFLDLPILDIPFPDVKTNEHLFSIL